MKTLTIFRTYLPDVTLGDTVVTDESGKVLLTDKCIELPNKGNKPQISCFPEGEYTCKWTFSPRMGKWTYAVLGVPKRAGIRIHSANYTHELLGCVAPCTSHADIDKDGIIDGVSSRDALKRLEAVMGKEDFRLVVNKKG